MAAAKDAKVVWKSGLAFEGIGGSGLTVLLDTIAEEGGGTGFSPMELALVSLASCTAMDVISILKKKRQDVTGFEIVTRGTRADDHPRIYTDIEIEFVVRGHAVDPQAVQRAIELSADKYCSVSNMLDKAAKLTTTYRVEEAG